MTEDVSSPKPVMHWPAVVVLQQIDAPGKPDLRRLTRSLASTVVQDFRDEVLVLIVEPPSSRSLRANDADKPPTATLQVPADLERASQAIAEELEGHASRYAYVFLDLGEYGPNEQDVLIRSLGTAELGPILHRRLVQLMAPATQAVPEAHGDTTGWDVLVTSVLSAKNGTPDRRQILRELLGRLQQGVRADVRAVRRLVSRALRLELQVEDVLGGPSVGYADDHDPGFREGKLSPSEVRIRMHHGGHPNRESLARWARAITYRRVGLALGGSGAWGYAHAALIAAMEHERIPIDIITSASSGSLVGGYYSALGSPAIDMLQGRALRFDLAVLLAFYSMLPLELCIAWDTGFVPLNELEVTFFPVATNLSRMRPERMTNTTLPWGVRASSTAPGVFGSTQSANAVYVDGAVADNVPAQLAEFLGADLVVASNALPPPCGDVEGRLHLRSMGRLARWGLGFRLDELGASLGLMFHDTGDWQAHGYITYDAPAADYPLARTLLFHDGPEVFRSVQDQNEFKETLCNVREAWRRLALPRTGITPAVSVRNTWIGLKPGLESDGSALAMNGSLTEMASALPADHPPGPNRQ